MAIFNALIAVVLIVTVNHGAAYKPAANLHLDIQGANQVHLSLGEYDGEVVVTWSTPKTASSQLRFNEGKYIIAPDAVILQGWESIFIDNGTLHHTQYIHRASISNLKPQSWYTYQVKNNSDWSRSFTFQASGQADDQWFPKITVFGDFGLTNAKILPALLREQACQATDFLVHMGDFAYDLYQDNATYGDAWFNSVEPLYASQAVMTCVGNHEGQYDFLNYRSRFTMPNYAFSENLYFSWNAGITHWISYSTEFYFVNYDVYGPYPELAAAQLKFIEYDLIRANSNRKQRPWIFAFGHRPMYCSDSNDDDCVKMQDAWRTDLENLFYKYGVDMIFEAHQHTYERLWPTMNFTVVNSSTPNDPYNNPLAPVHIVTGAAGCREETDQFALGALGPWSAVRIADYGYGRVTIISETQLLWEQRDMYQNVVDAINLTRSDHKEYRVL